MISWALLTPTELLVAFVCVWVLVAAYVLTRKIEVGDRETPE